MSLKYEPASEPLHIYAFPVRRFDGDGVGDNMGDATNYPYNAVPPTPDLSPISLLNPQP